MFAYRTAWQRIIGIAAEHDQKETSEKRQGNVAVRWERTVGGGCIAVLSMALALRLGEHVDLIKLGNGEDESWSVQGVVKRAQSRGRDFEAAVLLNSAPKKEATEGRRIEEKEKREDHPMS